ncbi:hydrogenase nickel incorporation protein HypB [Pelagibaculum spongiae]|uniref:Hydrogenase maturation factor HypB n=1 Tax=Pelagibaculum spongiae TaxID=2080658 RepID=A0A2V1GSW8_9GAMM|nr:hydrogenase nickel incorporation protein HypB [Pelagibaculum spongiae]PVZ68805.1 hydrogenase accessory protein HypB [Pelagibaculum spongiae]
MCTTCGCGGDAAIIEGHTHSHVHSHSEQPTSKAEPVAAQHSHAPGMEGQRALKIEQDLLARNNRYAHINRHKFADRGLLALNLVSSPGSGKTSLLTETIELLKESIPCAVIEGDQQTTNDAERIRATGAPAIQINTGKGCHLDAHMVGHALEDLAVKNGGFLFIENVGNLVCPAEFDLGENARVVILSVTEGEDKPIKYPDIFANADLMILTKTDLLPHLDFDVEQCIDYARRIRPELKVLQLSSKTGEGMQQWTDWLKHQLSHQLEHKRQHLAEELAEVENQLKAIG